MREGFDDQTFDLFGRRARVWLQPRLGVSYAMGPAASIFVSYDRLVRKPNPRFLYAKLRSRSWVNLLKKGGDPRKVLTNLSSWMPYLSEVSLRSLS